MEYKYLEDVVLERYVVDKSISDFRKVMCCVTDTDWNFAKDFKIFAVKKLR